MSMSALRPVLLVAALLIALPAAAQQRIEQQMSPEQFKAAGLDRLSPEQLSNLNAWLNGKIDTVKQTASAEAKKKVEVESRGFYNFGSSEPIVAHIDGEFRGFGPGRQWTLDNGQVWRQDDDASLAGVRKTNPGVRINPSLIGNAWYMAIDGYNTRAKVSRVK